MAENERLDVLKNRRWLRVMQHIASNPQEDDILRTLTEAMYRTLRSVGKQIPLQHLLKAAARSQLGLSAELLNCRHDFAEMIERVAAEPETDATSSIAERYVEAILDRYLDQIGLRLIAAGPFPTFDIFCAQAKKWKSRIMPDMKRLASKLESGEALRVPAQPAAVRATERKELVTLSMLTGQVQKNRHGVGSPFQNSAR